MTGLTQAELHVDGTDVGSNADADVDREPGSAGMIVRQDGEGLHIVAQGDWSMTGIHAVESQLRSLTRDVSKSVRIDTTRVTAFDTGGAWLVEHLRRSVQAADCGFRHVDADERRLQLVEVVQDHVAGKTAEETIPETSTTNPVEALGKGVVAGAQDFAMGCYLIGSSIGGAQMKSGKRSGFRLVSIINQMDHMGLRAVPVITVMSFLIGAIIAQQGAYQLQFYGEELLTVYLVGVLHFREIGVLLTAIMVAGRTGSAITAEIGTMKMREEIDALQVIGLNPVAVLIFPRLLALIIVLPILTLLSDIAGIAGAIFISDLYVGITPGQFLEALRTEVYPQEILVGLIKAPFMALVIGLVAAVEGLKVSGSAESLGRSTTTAVVRAIFAVILMDGLFAVFFASIGF